MSVPSLIFLLAFSILEESEWDENIRNCFQEKKCMNDGSNVNFLYLFCGNAKICYNYCDECI